MWLLFDHNFSLSFSNYEFKKSCWIWPIYKEIGTKNLILDASNKKDIFNFYYALIQVSFVSIDQALKILPQEWPLLVKTWSRFLPSKWIWIPTISKRITCQKVLSFDSIDILHALYLQRCMESCLTVILVSFPSFIKTKLGACNWWKMENGLMSSLIQVH